MGSLPFVPRWYWIVAGFALLWGFAGCGAYLSQVSMSAADLAELPQVQRDIWAATPRWVLAAYAIAVWMSLIGAVSLLLRRRLALLAYIIALGAVLVQFGWTFLGTEILTRMPLAQALPLPVTVIALAGASVWFARYAIRRRWLG